MIETLEKPTETIAEVIDYHARRMEIADYIENYPEEFYINQWHGVKVKHRLDTKPFIFSAFDLDLKDPLFMLHNTVCGTTHCIAGWAQIVFKGRISENLDTSLEGQEILGLNEGESYRLFHLVGWPRKWKSMMHDTHNYPELQAKVAAEYIRSEDYMEVLCAKLPLTQQW